MIPVTRSSRPSVTTIFCKAITLLKSTYCGRHEYLGTLPGYPVAPRP